MGKSNRQMALDEPFENLSMEEDRAALAAHLHPGIPGMDSQSWLFLIIPSTHALIDFVSARGCQFSHWVQPETSEAVLPALSGEDVQLKRNFFIEPAHESPVGAEWRGLTEGSFSNHLGVI